LPLTTLGIFRFHDSVTEPGNAPLTVWQRSQKSLTTYAEFGTLYRFEIWEAVGLALRRAE
jgi:hypothetical protein